MTRNEFFRSFSVSRETTERFDLYERLLRKWNSRINLVSGASLEDFWSRHLLDSAQLFSLAPPKAVHWVDLGSGGGFPGLVIAILAAEKTPALNVTMVESDGRKAAFLSAVCNEIGIESAITLSRIESLDPLRADVISARALAPLPELLSLAAPHLELGGIGLFPKGAGADAEVTQALVSWSFSVQNIPSRSDPRGVILKLGDIARV